VLSSAAARNFPGAAILTSKVEHWPLPLKLLPKKKTRQRGEAGVRLFKQSLLNENKHKSGTN